MSTPSLKKLDSALVSAYKAAAIFVRHFWDLNHRWLALICTLLQEAFGPKSSLDL